MTTHQDKAIWELCRQGFHGTAAEAEAAWSKGQGYAPKEPLPLAREVIELIRIANRECRTRTAQARHQFAQDGRFVQAATPDF